MRYFCLLLTLFQQTLYFLLKLAILKVFVFAVSFNIRSMLMFSSTNYSVLEGSPTLYPVSKSSPVVESSHFLDNKIQTPKC